MLPLEKMRATTRCIVRNLLRWPLRALATSLGLGAAGALMMFGFFIGDAFDLIQRSYFEGAERQDATIHFTEHKTPDILREVMRLPGVLTAEPLYAAPARLSFGRESKRRAIFGVSPGAQMMRPIDKNHNPARVAPRGVVLARGLAKSLGASLGDEISIAALEGRRARGEVKITGISDELIGTAAYMNIQALGDFLGEGPRVSGALLRIDGNYAADLRRSLPSLPAVASLVFKEDSRRGFEETVESGMLFAAFITIGLAAVIIAGVAYNAARVSLAFRRRELATLRVLGFDRAQAARVLLGEIAVVAAIALPLCAVLGRGLVEYLAAGASNDLYQMPAVVSPRSYALDMLTVAAAVALACIPAKRELDRMDLTAAVKARE
jgi:putative ABC transport system permease protein